MITIANEDDAKLYEAVGQMAARVCGLEHVELVSEYKRRLVAGIEAHNRRTADAHSDDNPNSD